MPNKESFDTNRVIEVLQAAGAAKEKAKQYRQETVQLLQQSYKYNLKNKLQGYARTEEDLKIDEDIYYETFLNHALETPDLETQSITNAIVSFYRTQLKAAQEQNKVALQHRTQRQDTP